MSVATGGDLSALEVVSLCSALFGVWVCIGGLRVGWCQGSVRAVYFG